VRDGFLPTHLGLGRNWGGLEGRAFSISEILIRHSFHTQRAPLLFLCSPSGRGRCCRRVSSASKSNRLGPPTKAAWVSWEEREQTGTGVRSKQKRRERYIVPCTLGQGESSVCKVRHGESKRAFPTWLLTVFSRRLKKRYQGRGTYRSPSSIALVVSHSPPTSPPAYRDGASSLPQSAACQVQYQIAT